MSNPYAARTDDSLAELLRRCGRIIPGFKGMAEADKVQIMAAAADRLDEYHAGTRLAVTTPVVGVRCVSVEEVTALQVALVSRASMLRAVAKLKHTTLDEAAAYNREAVVLEAMAERIVPS